MNEIVIYSSLLCPFCYMAKQLLKQKGVAYHDINVDMRPALRREMVERAHGRHSVPQIFVGATHVGGCDDLYALDRAGELDRLLGVHS